MLVYFSGDWDVHWGSGAFDPPPFHASALPQGGKALARRRVARSRRVARTGAAAAAAGREWPPLAVRPRRAVAEREARGEVWTLRTNM